MIIGCNETQYITQLKSKPFKIVVLPASLVLPISAFVVVFWVISFRWKSHVVHLLHLNNPPFQADSLAAEHLCLANWQLALFMVALESDCW